MLDFKRFILATVGALAVAISVFGQAPQRKAGVPEGFRGPDPVKAGDVAPDFTLKTADGKQQVTLSSFRGKRPIALIFGSYT